MNQRKPLRPTVLALDLEGTLISNAMSQIARPGLHAFLERCRELFPRTVMFTTVKEPRFRDIARLLVSDGLAPTWFADIEYVHWQGATKNLAFIPGGDLATIVLVDDFEQYVHPGQEPQWLQIEEFAHPYSDTDTGLAAVLEKLEALVASEVSG
jgi:hypothetical protein